VPSAKQDPCPGCACPDTGLLQSTEPLAADDRLVRSTLAAAGDVISFRGCPRCTLIFRAPRPTQAQLDHYYSQVLPPQERRIMGELGVTPELAAARYDVRYAELFRDITALAGRSASAGHIVDLGGWNGQSLVPWLNAGWRGTLVDPGASLRSVKDPRIRCFPSVKEAAAAVPPADIVTSYHCLEHLLDLTTWRAEALAIGKPGTLWVVEVPFDVTSIRGLLGRQRLPSASVHEEHLNFFLPTSLGALAELMGLRVRWLGILVTPYWFGPTVALRLVAEQQRTGTAPAELRPRFSSGAALRRHLRWRLPLWRRWAGLKFRWYRLRNRSRG
jgi:hypothetical protein